MTKLHETNDISIGNVRITKEKLTIKVAGILTEESREIPWDKVGVRAYHTYFSIYSTDDPANINHGYSYMDDWNTWVLYNFVHAVLEHNNSEMTE